MVLVQLGLHFSLKRQMDNSAGSPHLSVLPFLIFLLLSLKQRGEQAQTLSHSAKTISPLHEPTSVSYLIEALDAIEKGFTSEEAFKTHEVILKMFTLQNKLGHLDRWTT